MAGLRKIIPALALAAAAGLGIGPGASKDLPMLREERVRRYGRTPARWQGKNAIWWARERNRRRAARRTQKRSRATNRRNG